MEEFNRKIDSIRTELEKRKSEKYAIVCSNLIPLDENKKLLYLSVLYSLIQYQHIPSEQQIFFLGRIAYGIGIEIENSVEKYIQILLEFSDADYYDFFEYAEQPVKYNMVLDGLLLISLERPSQEQNEYLVEIAECCGILKNEWNYLCLLAKSILTQDSDVYEKAKCIGENTAVQLDLVPYIQNYYSGAIINTETEKYYSAPDIRMSVDMDFPSEYFEKQVTFKNLKITLEDIWKFLGCENVTFQNCQIKGDENSMSFYGCKKIAFIDCHFMDFSVWAVTEGNVMEADFENCTFTNCFLKPGYISHADRHIAGVIHAETMDNGVNQIHNCVFDHCGLDGFYWQVWNLACISDCQCRVIGSSFINCRVLGDSLYSSKVLFSHITEEQNNCVIESEPLALK